jgi:hypothetical protein
MSGPSKRKYRRIGGRRNAVRRRLFGGRSRKIIWRYNRRKRISRRRKRVMVYKKRNLRRARKRGAWHNFTARRVNQVSLEITLDASPGPDVAHLYHADQLWFGYSKSISKIQDKYRHYKMKSISFKFDSFKVRTMMRTVTTEGGTETTSEQIIEPSSANVRYRWNKWGDKGNPGHMMGNDDRIEECMRTKCITSCKDKFWGIWKPRGAISLLSLPTDGDAKFGPYISRMQCINVDENGPPHLGFWFCAENPLPDQFFKPDPPVVRTAKMFIDFNATFWQHNKWTS